MLQKILCRCPQRDKKKSAKKGNFWQVKYVLSYLKADFSKFDSPYCACNIDGTYISASTLTFSKPERLLACYPIHECAGVFGAEFLVLFSSRSLALKSSLKSHRSKKGFE